MRLAHAAVAASGEGSGGTVKKGEQKSSPVPGNAELEHLNLPIRLGKLIMFSLSDFCIVPIFSLGGDQHHCPSSTAVLCHPVGNTTFHSCGSKSLTQERLRIAISSFFGKSFTI